MNKFEKVSIPEYAKSNIINSQEDIKYQYDSIKIPKRATKHSAGYDIYSPIDFELDINESITFPLGIKCQLDEDKFLMIVPRSGLGFNYNLTLSNTCGIIDADYYNNPNNEGHIHIKLINGNFKSLKVKAGDAIAQGIILPYYKTIDDESIEERSGGLGSTNC